MMTMMAEGHTCARWRPHVHVANTRSFDWYFWYWSFGGPYFEPPLEDAYIGIPGPWPWVTMRAQPMVHGPWMTVYSIRGEV